jgi:endonuclease I
MKTKLSLIAFLCATVAFGQIPSGYYSTATGTGFTLKTQLYNKIKGHTDQGYNGLWTTYATSDRDKEYENDNSVIDIYSENPSGTDPYKYTLTTNQCGTYSVEGNCYNREHIVPQSIFNSSAPMVSDAHHIPPTDGKVNGIRSNFPHGNVATASYTSKNGGKLGTSAVSGYTGTVFEPINEFKGDVARMYFYFATRYENTVSGYSFAMFNGMSNQVFTTAFLNMLKNWHANDPVSAREIARNNAIYARQGNRNPYIDHPEYVNMIWGGSTGGGTTTTSSELFFTEYVEGSSNNKALEISNKTGASMNLSSYSIKKQSNGAGAWSTGITLSGTLASNGKYVIVNSLISSSCYSTVTANLSTSGTELTFNGNDAVGLFKNGVLIDIIGTFNGSTSNFSADETLRRKSTVTGPTTTFNKSTQWDVFVADTCSGIGNRIIQTATEEVISIDFQVYPNPSFGDFTIDFNNNGPFTAEAYTLIGQKVLEKQSNNTMLINNLPSGIYLIKVTKDNKSVTKKIVIN